MHRNADGAAATIAAPMMVAFQTTPALDHTSSRMLRLSHPLLALATCICMAYV